MAGRLDSQHDEGMRQILERAKTTADRTPPERDRTIDAIRVGSMVVVVLGHWLMALLWAGPSGLEFGNALDESVSLQFLTWALQVMPLFFLAGGFSNGRSLGSTQDVGAWIAGRARRLLVPIVPLVAFWAAVTWLFGSLLPPDLLRAATLISLVPLWFLAVYLGVVVLAPISHAAWRRWGWWSVAAPAAAAAVVDLTRFGGDVEWIGWANFLFVWGAVHQAGYGWSHWARPDIGRWLAPAGLAVLALLVAFGPYPISMIGLDDQAVNNTTPPTVVLLALAAMQAGVVGIASTWLRRRLSSGRAWIGVVLAGGMAMSWYAWHLTVMVLVTGADLLAGGILLSPEPLTASWWASRPVWIAVLAVTTLPIVLAVVQLEWRRGATRAGWLAALGALGSVASIAALVLGGISTWAVAAFGLSAWAAGAITFPGVGTFGRSHVGS